MHPPIDATQVSRIEGVHRGFLYQHLFAVACLLTLDQWGGLRVVVEHDEDVQVETEAGWAYFQVKYRDAAVLSPSALKGKDGKKGVKERFDEIRALHENGSRSGKASFYVVANCPPSEQLAKEMLAWPEDIVFLHPETEATELPAPTFPAPWPSLLAAMDACRILASKVPYSKLESATLVDKLTSHVAMVCTGRGGGGSHEIARASLSSLFEQFLAQLHHLPAIPAPLRPSGTSVPENVEGLRIIEGYPGMGKTTWAALVVRHTPRVTVYFDADQAPHGGLVPALVREVTATLGDDAPDLASSVLATGLSGTESLAMLDQLLRTKGHPAPLVLVDNAQRADVEALATAIKTAEGFDWLVLSHPGEAIRTLCALTGCEIERLAGWTEGAVAREAADSELPSPPGDIARLHEVTEGNPLFIRSIIRLAKAEAGGVLEDFLNSLDIGAHLTRTDQERLLGRVAARLREASRQAMALAGLSNLPLPEDVLRGAALHALGGSDARLRSALRELVEWSVLEVFPDRRLRIRDAYMPVAMEERGLIEEDRLAAAAGSMADWAFERVEAQDDQIRHLLLHLNLLPLAGRVQRLIEVATGDDEFFIEVGLMPEVKRILGRVVEEQSTSERDRFTALDTLAFWAIHERDLRLASRLISEMRSLLDGDWCELADRHRWTIKALLLAGRTGEWETARNAGEALLAEPDLDPVFRNITVYNLAGAALECGELEIAERLAVQAALAYFEALDISPADLVFASLETTADLIGTDRIGTSDVKRLADALDMQATVQVRLGRHPGLAWMHAHKLYILNGSYSSAVRVGKEIIESMLATGDPAGARRTMEGFMLPVVREFRLAHEVVPVRAQYAAVLAFCGEVDAARAVLEDLAPYALAVPHDVRLELESQRRVVEDVAAGRLRLPDLVQVPPELQTIGEMQNRIRTSAQSKSRRRGGRRPSRNAPCPCGSGKKYKGCCGRREA